jgi:signal transduction histidine kinase
MNSFLDQVFLLLTTPPGNLAYHLVLSFSIFGALQASLSHWRSSSYPQGRRMVIGLLILLLGQLLLFATTALAWQGILSSEVVLPPLDRAVSLLSIVVIIWLWAFPEGVRIADAAFILTLLLVLAFSVLAGLWWYGQGGTAAYNGSWVDVMNSVLAMALSLSGVIILIVRKANNWGVGLAMLVMLFIGHLVHWLSPAGGQAFAGPVRLLEMTAFPLLLALPQRFPQVIERVEKSETSLLPEKRRYTTDPKVMQAFLSLAGEKDPEKFYKDVTRTLSQMMLADVCLLALPPEGGGDIIIPSGYNLIFDRKIDGFSLDSRQCPVLVNALKRGRKLRLPASSTSPDLKILAKSLHASSAGHLLAAPITAEGEKPYLQIILLTPYSNRGWTDEDLEFLSDAAISLSAVLQRAQEITGLREDLRKSQESLKLATSQSDGVVVEIGDIQGKLKETEEQLRQEQERSENLAALIDKSESLQEEMEQLVIENQELMELLHSQQESIPEIEQYDRELRMALEDVAHLRAALSDADKKLMEFKALRIDQTSEDRQIQGIAAISEELRQPISSIVGYTEILLGESVGILGTHQKKFLDRVKISAKRVESLINDLARVAHVDESAFGLTPEIVDLSAVIDEAVADMFAHLSNKNIVFRVDLPEKLPKIHADRDALQQVLTHLLQNAGSITPVDGEISLQARIETRDNEPAYVLFQVSDTGGGIPREALGKVFSRMYRTETVDIPGIADQGVGLSIVKTLVEAHGGRIWVDTEENHGSTFSVLLPLSDEQFLQQERNEVG